MHSVVYDSTVQSVSTTCPLCKLSSSNGQRGCSLLCGRKLWGTGEVAFTMDVYSHIIEGMQSDAMALLDEVLPAGVNGTKNKINANLTPTL